MLSCVLLPAWASSGGFGTVKTDADQKPIGMAYLSDAMKTSLSPWLLPALGLLWVIGAGGMDLSVWAVFALAAAVAGSLAAAGRSPIMVLAAVAGVGLAVGLTHAAMAFWLRLPSVVVTLFGAIVIVSITAGLMGGEPMALELKGEMTWGGIERPGTLTAGFFVIAIVTGLLAGEGRRGGHSEGPGAVATALGCSGLLSALGGLCWLVRSGWTPAPGHLFGDFRVVAAVVLAGGVAMRKSGRLLAGLLLLPGLLLATAWRQCIAMPSVWPVEWNPLLLAAMVLGTHWAWIRSGRSWRPGDQVPKVVSVIGLLLTAGSAWSPGGTAGAILLWTGLAVWGLAMLAGLVRWRQSAPPPMPTGAGP